MYWLFDKEHSVGGDRLGQLLRPPQELALVTEAQLALTMIEQSNRDHSRDTPQSRKIYLLKIHRQLWMV